MAQPQTPPKALAPAAPKQQDANKALAEDQLKLARQALEELDSLWKDARLDLLDSRVAVWERTARSKRSKRPGSQEENLSRPWRRT